MHERMHSTAFEEVNATRPQKRCRSPGLSRQDSSSPQRREKFQSTKKCGSRAMCIQCNRDFRFSAELRQPRFCAVQRTPFLNATTQQSVFYVQRSTSNTRHHGNPQINPGRVWAFRGSTARKNTLTPFHSTPPPLLQRSSLRCHGLKSPTRQLGTLASNNAFVAASC